MSSPENLQDAYGPGNILFRVLEPMGWGDLLNLGYYTPPTLPALPAGLASFQRRLVARSTALLRLTARDRVLDAACGRGYSSHLMGRRGCRVTGVDLLDAHVEEAVRRFGGRPRVRYLAGDLTALRRPPADGGPRPFPDGSLTKVHCLEAAFHLGPDGRRAFLEDVFRLLAPGGRLVLVDFVWRTGDPAGIAAADPGRLVRDTWRFEEFEPLSGYHRHALDIGYRIRLTQDWTRPVTGRFLRLAQLCAGLSAGRAGRRLLCRRWPALSALTARDWLRFAAVVHAHTAVRHASGYAALVLDRPAR
ncbi:hypothetical protein GCM10018793_23200 [Streptomyces sulfonofaciens]|uniref:Methyltransferase domain-containing protein n=1 Tax=Streptomyces sulfonofaciens TaxID=68272 RepID=A0A919KXE2_9ACTN|nr:class I SAM-dependent methyltransferase [Streptomyces sulfonofaciens]GHH76750.1 hypothetical protein GCM10018793_23200 [Streptomyces sulfonofaciens]